MLKAAVIGLGVGEKHAEAYHAHQKCSVAALCDLDATRLREVGERFPDARLTNNPNDVIADPDIDVVSIASYDDNHHDQIVASLNHGKHLFVEKPVCLTENELSSIRRTLKRNPGLRLSANLNLRTCPRFARLREMIAAGDMGDIFLMEADYLWGRSHKLTNGWRAKMDYYSIIHGAAVHMIDLVLWSTGKRPTTVQALGNRIATAGSQLRFNDFAITLLGFDDGSTAKVTGMGGCVHPHFHRVVTYGTKKTFAHDHNGARLYITCDPATPPETIEDEYPGVAFKQNLVHTFIDAVRNPGCEPIVPEQDVFETMSVCLAAEKAMISRETITIEYF
ncbi:MAG: Gfo/Idh/MocA family oxidoreductase [Proteobacteria bacterium]|nr:Gfo/Idh/MocA family oxidoreductase [Pseudomonadota bacterium]MBU1611553.1 Gfo/Idh/MocA family oxidoreductase [Pseudomonadota bacterium]